MSDINQYKTHLSVNRAHCWSRQLWTFSRVISLLVCGRCVSIQGWWRLWHELFAFDHRVQCTFIVLSVVCWTKLIRKRKKCIYDTFCRWFPKPLRAQLRNYHVLHCIMQTLSVQRISIFLLDNKYDFSSPNSDSRPFGGNGLSSSRSNIDM